MVYARTTPSGSAVGVIYFPERAGHTGYRTGSNSQIVSNFFVYELIGLKVSALSSLDHKRSAQKLSAKSGYKRRSYGRFKLGLSSDFYQDFIHTGWRVLDFRCKIFQNIKFSKFSGNVPGWSETLSIVNPGCNTPQHLVSGLGLGTRSPLARESESPKLYSCKL